MYSIEAVSDSVNALYIYKEAARNVASFYLFINCLFLPYILEARRRYR